MDTLRAMQIFLAVVQSGSLSSAGRRIGMSAASVSRYINALEDRIGSRLLNRSSRQLSLTEAGAIYFRHAEQIVQHVEEAADSISQIQVAPRGTLRVHSRMLVGNLKIVPALPEFLATYPEIKVDLVLSNSVVDIVEQNFDIDIRIGALQDSTLIAKKLADSERVLCASPLYLERSSPVESPSDLTRHNCLTYRAHTGRTTWRFANAAGKVTEIPVDGSFQTDNGMALRAMTLNHCGIALMPDWAIRDEVESGRLVRLLTDHRVSYEAFDYGIFAVYQQRRLMATKLRAFIDFISALFKHAV